MCGRTSRKVEKSRGLSRGGGLDGQLILKEVRVMIKKFCYHIMLL